MRVGSRVTSLLDVQIQPRSGSANTMSELVVTIHQPNFMPWIGFFGKTKRADIYIALDDVVPSRGSSSLTNRCLLSRQDQDRWFTIPLPRSDRGRLPLHQLVSSDPTWMTSLRSRIREYYREAAHIDRVLEWLDHLVPAGVERSSLSITEFNSLANSSLAEELHSSGYEIVQSHALSVRQDSRSLRLAELVHRVGGTVYLSGEGARSYLEEEPFVRLGIEVRYFSMPQNLSAQISMPGMHRSVLDLWARFGLDDLRRVLA